MRRWPVVGVLLALLWLFVRGVALEPATLAGEFLIGLVVGMVLAFVFRRFYRDDIQVLARLKAVPAMVAYFVLFVKELISANLDVAYRVLAPSMPISPHVIEIPLRIETDLAIATLANSITLTPGTLTMDYDDERNSLYVHAIWGEDRDGVVAPIRRWEDYALRIFDERRDPDDPVPLAPRDRSFEGGDGADE